MNNPIDLEIEEDDQLIEKTAKKKADKEKVAKVKPKAYYDVKVECMLPATLTYRILAEDAHQAGELIKGKTPNSVQHRLIGRKEIQMKVYDAGSCMVRFIKKLTGV